MPGSLVVCTVTGHGVERAVAAATKAYADWRKVPPRERGKALLILRPTRAKEQRGGCIDRRASQGLVG